MNRDKEKFIAEKLDKMADLMPDYDARKLYMRQVAAAFRADLDGQDAAPEEPKQEEPKKAPKQEEHKELSKTEVRAFLRETIDRTGTNEGVKEAIASLGFEKFNDVPAEKYPELMDKVRAL